VSPPPAEFKPLKTFEQWRDKLTELLDDADTIGAQDPSPQAQVLKLNKRLTDFQVWSPPDTPGLEDLDAIAENARLALLDDAVGDRVRELANTRSVLLMLGKELERREAEDRQAAASMRLDKLTAALPKVNDAIHAALELKQVLDGSTDKDLAVTLENALDDLQQLRETVEEIVRA
jgi:hypothetical protein